MSVRPQGFLEDQFIGLARSKVALRDVLPKEEHRAIRRGFVLVTCGDMNHIMDILNHLVSWLETDRIHLLARNGGACNLDFRHPENQRTPACGSLALEISESLQIKRVRYVYLLGHWPCGHSRLHRLNMSDTIRALIRAKDALRISLPDIFVGTLFHYYSCAGKRRHTYYLHRESMLRLWRNDTRRYFAEI